MRLNNNQIVFFELLRAGLWEKECRLTKYTPVDFAEVLRIAEEQAVVGLIAAGLEHVTDIRFSKYDALPFLGQALQLEQRNSAMNSFIGELVDKMKDANIYTLLVKGQGVAQSYERPLWRASGDIDLLLNEDNYEKAKAFLTPLASNVERERKAAKHLGMTIDSWPVELHGKLRCGLSNKINRELYSIQKDVFENRRAEVWDNGGSEVPLLGVENHVIYVFIHFLNHFYKGGVGLRQICDWIRLMWSNRNSLNVLEIKQHIRAMGLVTEWNAFGALAVDYLGLDVMAVPLFDDQFNGYNRKMIKKKAERIIAFVMAVGNFGHKRDLSYYGKYAFLVRKIVSFGQRCGDLIRHARIFPIDSLRFFPHILFNGLRSALIKEG